MVVRSIIADRGLLAKFKAFLWRFGGFDGSFPNLSLEKVFFSLFSDLLFESKRKKVDLVQRRSLDF